MSLPRGSLMRLLRDALPANIVCSGSVGDFLEVICLEFLELISSETNDVCIKRGKKIITYEHVKEALKILEFSDYIAAVNSAVNISVSASTEKIEKKKKKRKRFEGITNDPIAMKKKQDELLSSATTSSSCSSLIQTKKKKK